jgi:hypothetical protein
MWSVPGAGSGQHARRGVSEGRRRREIRLRSKGGPISRALWATRKPLAFDLNSVGDMRVF